jgi:two-component system, sensor histidine kinase and response regulator
MSSDEAIKRLGITQEIYDELYGDFVVFAKGKAGSIGRVAGSGDFPQAGKLAHSIKGIAGNLGVDAVSEAAKQVEHGVIEGKSPEELAGYIKNLMQRIAEL